MLGAALMDPMVHPQTQPHLLTEDQEQDEGYYFGMQPTHGVKLTKMQQYNKKLSISHMCKFFHKSRGNGFDVGNPNDFII